MMRAYKIAMGIILFQLSLPITHAIGFPGPLSGMSLGDALLKGLTSLEFLWSVGIGLIGIGITNRLAGLRLNVGAVVFAGAFQLGNLPLSATLSALRDPPINLLPEITIMVSTAVTIVFLFAFIQLASTGGKGAH